MRKCRRNLIPSDDDVPEKPIDRRYVTNYSNVTVYYSYSVIHANSLEDLAEQLQRRPPTSDCEVLYITKEEVKDEFHNRMVIVYKALIRETVARKFTQTGGCS